MIRSITVTLYERTETGADDFGAPVFTETMTDVPGVLVTPISAQDMVTDTQLYGKKGVYELCLPKGDAHVWDDCRVTFFG